MPYKKIKDLPEPIQKNLPEKAQNIYMSAFNHAFESYGDDPSKIKTADSVEEVAHKVAWSAVKKSYMKNENDKWVKIP